MNKVYEECNPLYHPRTDSEWRDVLLSQMYQCHLRTFRMAFSRLSEVRSIIPNSVKLMALAATATRRTRSSICRILGMSA